jgi:CRISPR system Cascade subunit CasA
MTEQKVPSFNLWTEPWITLEKPNGGVDCLGIEQTLKRAHEYRAVYEQSPLVVVGIHRLLVAILQFALAPQENEDLRQLWRAGHFAPDVIDDFGAKYAQRFDLFSVNTPFMQSADLPIAPGEKDKVSFVSRLTFDTPSGTYVSHYTHGDEESAAFCPPCVAKHLLTIPAFATSGGPGIKPSINGVPPVYLLPGGSNLRQSLIASLVTPAFQPTIRSQTVDKVWWEHDTNVGFADEVNDIGYCHSLTFPARRVRIHPQAKHAICSRCGSQSRFQIKTIVYEMGESRPKKSEVWFDPFVAYIEAGGKRTQATPIRPNYRKRGWAIWREFAGLFLLDTRPKESKQEKTIRPTVIGQLADLDMEGQSALSFRCVGVMTDNKAKIFQWMDAGFEVPLVVLKDENAGYDIRQAVGFSTECLSQAGHIFEKYFRRPKSKRYDILKQRMDETFWAQIAEPFRQFVLKMDKPENYESARQFWAKSVLKQLKNLFKTAGQSVGESAEHLGQYALAEKELNIQLEIKRKEFLG